MLTRRGPASLPRLLYPLWATVALSWWEASYLCWTVGCYSQVCIWHMISYDIIWYCILSIIYYYNIYMPKVSKNANYKTFVFFCRSYFFQPSSVFTCPYTGSTGCVRPVAGYAYFRRAVTKSLETRFCTELHLAPGPETWRSRDVLGGFCRSQGVRANNAYRFTTDLHSKRSPATHCGPQQRTILYDCTPEKHTKQMGDVTMLWPCGIDFLPL